MLLDNTYRVLPLDARLRLAVVSTAPGVYRLAVSAGANWLASYSPNPTPLDPNNTINDVNRSESGQVGGVVEQPSIWFELNDQLAMYLCAPILQALGIPTNAYVRDSDGLDIIGGYPQSTPPLPFDFNELPAPGGQTQWHWFLSYPDSTNPSVSDDLAVAITYDGTADPYLIKLPLLKCDGHTTSEGYGKASQIIDVAFALAKLATMARVIPDDLANCISISFEPTIDAAGYVEVKARANRAYHRLESSTSFQFAEISPIALFVRLCDLLIGGLRYPHRKHMLPFFPVLELEFQADALQGDNIWCVDPNSPNHLVATTISENADSTYLKQLRTSGLFVTPGARCDGLHDTYASCSWCLQPVLVSAMNDLPAGTLHWWWKAQAYTSIDGPWPALFTAIRHSMALAASRLLVDTDYLRFHTTVNLDSVLNAIDNAKADAIAATESDGLATRNKCDSVEVSVRDKVATAEASLHQDLAGQMNGIRSQIDSSTGALATGISDCATTVSQNNRADVQAAASGIHQSLAAQEEHIISAIDAIPPGEDTAQRLDEITSRQQADIGAVAAVCLATLRRLVSPKRFGQIIEQLSNLEYRPVRKLRPNEDLTAGETGPLSPYFELFDKFGRARKPTEKEI